MENPQYTDTSEDVFSNKNAIIFVLCLLLFAGSIGVDFIRIIIHFLESVSLFLLNILYYILGLLGYSTGSVINKTADVLGDSAKFGVDIAEGTAHNIGNILKNTPNQNIDNAINRAQPNKNEPQPLQSPTQCTPVPCNAVPCNAVPCTSVPCTASSTTVAPSTPMPAPKSPSPDSPENPIQKPITANKTNWCLVGEYQQKRGCIEINDGDKCISGQLFPNKQMCLSMK
jgi:hypothetical protein